MGRESWSKSWGKSYGKSLRESQSKANLDEWIPLFLPLALFPSLATSPFLSFPFSFPNFSPYHPSRSPLEERKHKSLVHSRCRLCAMCWLTHKIVGKIVSGSNELQKRNNPLGPNTVNNKICVQTEEGCAKLISEIIVIIGFKEQGYNKFTEGMISPIIRC